MDLGEIGKLIISSSIFEGLSEDNAEDILRWCEINNEKYTDQDFPAHFSSLSHLGASSAKFKNWSKYQWIRLSDCFDSLELFKDEVSPLDIIQGALGDCNLLCALSCLSEVPGAIQELFLLKEQNPFGLYAVRLCKDGVWQSVVLDDFIPCGGELKTPCFSQCLGGEIWVMVLEKAWAKLNGSYENTELTSLPQCLSDLTGAPTRSLSCGENIWEDLVLSKEKNYIVCASASSTKSSQKLLETVGLIGSLSYAVLRTAEAGERLIKLRNPWSKAEWNGDWSDKSEKWTPKLKRKLEVTEAEDGMFWMSFQDFIYYFSCVTVCEITSGFVYSSVEAGHEKNGYCVIHVEVGTAGEYNLSVNQKDRLYMSTIERYDYSPVRVIVCRDLRGSVEYVAGLRGCERNFNQRVQLRRGKYAVFVMFDWQFDEREFSVSVYGAESVSFQVLGASEGFLQNVYKNRALSIEETFNYESKGIADCFKYHEILPEGFGYFYILNNNPRLTLEETTYFKKFKNLALMQPFSGSKYTVTVNSGCDSLIILQVVTIGQYTLDYSSSYSVQDPSEILIA